jgi:hypothetical protein
MLANRFCGDGEDRADSSHKGVFGTSALCIPAKGCAKAQGLTSCGTHWVTRISRDPECNGCGFTLQVASGESLVPRIRHCVECPNCHIVYLVSLSPYCNGSYVMPTIRGSSREYALYCSCRRGSAPRVWRWSEVKACEISKAAYDRGYGTRDEVVLIEVRPRNA